MSGYTNAAGHVTQLTYDPGFGVVRKVVAPNGVVGTLTYDVLGRQIRQLRTPAAKPYFMRITNAACRPGSPGPDFMK